MRVEGEVFVGGGYSEERVNVQLQTLVSLGCVVVASHRQLDLKGSSSFHPVLCLAPTTCDDKLEPRILPVPKYY